MKKTILITLAMFLTLQGIFANNNRSFGIFVDSRTYGECRVELEAYRSSVQSDGLDAFIISENWSCPEQVRDSIRYLYENKSLEGVVFVGDIPIPMIQGAQHMTSAFKMDENPADINNTSVPSDRFYDDFDLKFNLISRDTTNTLFHYYRLAPESPQEIQCDIYSARIKPSSHYRDRYAELKAYLDKVVRLKKESNPVDKITSYTGEGSFSNSLIAWKDETITLGEQFPSALNTADGMKFYVFSMFPYPKDYMLDEIRRDDLDLVLFHEHGVPERQYLSGIPEPGDLDEYYDYAKSGLRNFVKMRTRYGFSLDETKDELAAKGLDPSWFEEAVNPSREEIEKDSIQDLHTGIILDDIHKAATNVRMAIFDACYNGDFREPDCVAARYIFSEGNSVIGIGNSVNVLQDKSSSDLLGMLSAGYRVGEWMMKTNILESHIHGDPTFHFASDGGIVTPDLRNDSCEYWKSCLSDDFPCDIQGLALHRLYELECPGLSQLLLATFERSPYYMVRLQCMHLLAHYNDGNYEKLLHLAADDPYEFIRRKAAYYMGKVGRPEQAEDLVQMYLNDYNAHRINFNVFYSAGHFEGNVFTDALNKAIDSADWLYDKEAFRKEAEEKYTSPVGLMTSAIEAIKDKSLKPGRRAVFIRGMRNNPYPHLAMSLVDVIRDSSEDTKLRRICAETLGWYVRAWNRQEIAVTLTAMLSSDVSLPEEVREEALKTVNRLNEYNRK